jgi:predicted RNA binding protein with dsRBD fold (UPF0201 family)
MMALDEMMAAFQEGLAGFSGGPLNPPLGHILADAVVAFKALPAMEWDKAAVADALVELRQNTSIDPEVALVSMNTIARKAAELRPGLVTDTLIMASEPPRIKSLYQRAEKTWAGLQEGKSLAEVAQGLEKERQGVVEARANAMFSQMAGKEINIHVTKLVPGARRKGRLVEDYIAFDPLADVDITIDGKTMHLEGVIHDLIPQVARGEREDIAPIMPMVAAVLDEMTLMGNTIMNITVPAAVAAAMGKMSPDDAAREAAANAPLTAGIPGARVRAEKVAALAVKIMA